MIKNRMYQQGDHEKVMNFFREIYRETGNQHCWLPQRWEYAEYNCNPIFLERGWKDWKEYIKIWEEDDKIVAIAHKEAGYEIFLQIRPNYEHLAPEMLDFLEESVPKEKSGKECELWLYISGTQNYLEPLLEERNYVKNDDCSYFNYQELDGEYTPELPEGFSFVDGNDVEDEEDRGLCCHLGFHPEDEPGEKKGESFDMEKSPLFKPELEIMTQDDKGNLCSFCVVWYDEDLKIGMFEPVCTRIDYRKKGLGKAMIIEGLRRLKEMGAEKAYVESYGDNRKAFYNSAGFVTYDSDYPWRKKF